MSASISRFESILGPLARSWRWTLSYGIVCELVGLAVLVWPRQTFRMIAILFAVQLIATSVFRFVVALIRSGDSMVQKLQLAVIASFAFVVGIVLLENPRLSLRLIAIVLGVYWTIHGSIELVEAVTYGGRTERTWVVASGAMGMIVGLILILAAVLPSTFLAFRGPVLLMTRTLGAWLVVFGLILVVRAFRARLPHQATATTSGPRPAGT